MGIKTVTQVEAVCDRCNTPFNEGDKHINFMEFGYIFCLLCWNKMSASELAFNFLFISEKHKIISIITNQTSHGYIREVDYDS